jgi:hypothetical protein
MATSGAREIALLMVAMDLVRDLPESDERRRAILEWKSVVLAELVEGICDPATE